MSVNIDSDGSGYLRFYEGSDPSDPSKTLFITQTGETSGGDQTIFFPYDMSELPDLYYALTLSVNTQNSAFAFCAMAQNLLGNSFFYRARQVDSNLISNAASTWRSLWIANTNFVSSNFECGSNAQGRWAKIIQDGKVNKIYQYYKYPGGVHSPTLNTPLNMPDLTFTGCCSHTTSVNRRQINFVKLNTNQIQGKQYNRADFVNSSFDYILDWIPA